MRSSQEAAIRVWVKVWVIVDKRGYLCGNSCVSIVGNFPHSYLSQSKGLVRVVVTVVRGVEKDISPYLTI